MSSSDRTEVLSNLGASIMSSVPRTARAITRVNPYLSGNFSPVLTETTTTRLHVRGQIPSELDGRLLRIGRNPAAPVDPERHHWFTGSGMVHGVRLRDGNAEWSRSKRCRHLVGTRLHRATPCHDRVAGPCAIRLSRRLGVDGPRAYQGS